MSKKQETIVTLQDLPALARDARKAAGLTQVEAADRLHSDEHTVLQSHVSKAERIAGPTWQRLQLRMIEELAGWQVEGPLWRLRK